MPSQKQFGAIMVLASKTYTTTTQGSAIDLQGYINPGGRTLKAVLLSGTALGTNVSVTVKIQDSDDTTAANFTDISGAAFTAITTTGTPSPGEIHFQTRKRYIRAVATHGTDMTNAIYGVIAVAEKRYA